MTANARVALLLCALPLVSAVAGPYDSPLRTRHVHLAPDPHNHSVKRQVSCFYYRSIVVKQIDLGEVGADRLALLPVLSGNGTPCRAEIETTEYAIPSETWSGHFLGVKGGYAFFDAPDGTDGGLGFMVFRLHDRKLLFRDIAEHGLQSIEILDGAVKLRYKRVFEGNCSMVEADASCRDAFVHDSGVAPASLAICAQGYRAAKEAMAKERCEAQSSRRAACVTEELAHRDQQQWDKAPSVIVYEAEVIVSDAAPLISPRSDALACRPSD